MFVDHNAAALLAELSRETFIEAYRGVHSQDNLEQYCSTQYSEEATEVLLRDEKTCAYVAMENSEPAGFFVLINHNCPIEQPGRGAELKQIYVLPDYYGGGLGRSLFTQACKSAMNAGGTYLWLCVSSINHRARAFYEKLDFERVGAGPELLVGSDRLESLILVRQLS